MSSVQQFSFYRFIPLFLVVIIDAMGGGLIFPILAPLFLDKSTGILSASDPAYLRDFYYGLSMAVFFVCTFFFAPLIGDLSDRFGRKKIIIACLILTALSFLISAIGILISTVILVILGRALAGLAAGSMPIAQAAIIDVSTPENKPFNLGLITMASSVGYVMGPLIGGYFSGAIFTGRLGFATPFIISAILAIINFVSLYFTFAETFTPLKKSSFNIIKGLSYVKLAFTLSALKKLAIAFLLIQAAWGIYIQYIMFFLTSRFHYTSNGLGMFIAYISVVFALSLTLIIRLFMRIMKIETMALVSLVIVLLGFIFAMFFQNQLVQWLCAFPMSAGIGLNYMALLTLLSNRVDQSSQGLVMGISESLGSLSWALSGLAMSVIISQGTHFPFLISIILLALSLWLLVGDYRKKVLL